MSKSTKALFAKIRNGGYGSQFDFEKKEAEYKGARQTNGCYGCDHYRGGEECAKRDRIRFASDDDYGKCIFWSSILIDEEKLKRKLQEGSSANNETRKTDEEKSQKLKKKGVKKKESSKTYGDKESLRSETEKEERTKYQKNYIINYKGYFESIINKNEDTVVSMDEIEHIRRNMYSLETELLFRIFIKSFYEFYDYESFWSDTFEKNKAAYKCLTYELLRDCASCGDDPFYPYFHTDQVPEPSFFEELRSRQEYSLIYSLIEGFGCGMKGIFDRELSELIYGFDEILVHAEFRVLSSPDGVILDGFYSFSEISELVKLAPGAYYFSFFIDSTGEIELDNSSKNPKRTFYLDDLKMFHHYIEYHIAIKNDGIREGRGFDVYLEFGHNPFMKFPKMQYTIFTDRISEGKSLLDKIVYAENSGSQNLDDLCN